MYRELCFRGRLISLYNGIVYYNPSDLDIDHYNYTCTSLLGVEARRRDMCEQFANCPIILVSVGAQCGKGLN